MKSTRTPVKRPSAEAFILISLTCFGLTVAVTRVYLELTGYPQIGNSVLHIAHALWGGLLLLLAALVPLILMNRWAFTLSAVLSGAGVGLFIDEVGKFITQKNDYFFPPAAPLIYAAFLLMILLFVAVRRTRRPSPRASMYRAVLGLQELLDNNLDPRERARLLVELENGRTSPEPHIAQLAEQLSAYLQGDSISLVEYRPGYWARAARQTRRLGARVGRKNHRRLIIALSTIIVASALLVMALLVGAWLTEDLAAPVLIQSLLSSAEVAVQDPVLFIVRLLLQFLVGLLYLIALFWFWRGDEDRAVNTAIFAALLSFTAVNLLNFYLNQFGALAAFFFNLAVFFVLLAYRSWYLTPRNADA
jgi:hypothetical protein